MRRTKWWWDRIDYWDSMVSNSVLFEEKKFGGERIIERVDRQEVEGVSVECQTRDPSICLLLVPVLSNTVLCTRWWFLQQSRWLELITPKNTKREDHSPQAIREHFVASHLNPSHAVVSVLTDLNTNCIFFWFALGDCNSRIDLLCKLDLKCDGAAEEAKHLLDCLCDNSIACKLPAAFVVERQPFQAVVNDFIQWKKVWMDLDGGNAHNPDQDSTLLHQVVRKGVWF